MQVFKRHVQEKMNNSKHVQMVSDRLDGFNSMKQVLGVHIQSLMTLELKPGGKVNRN